MRVIGIGPAGWQAVRTLREEEPAFVRLDRFCAAHGLVPQHDCGEGPCPIDEPDEARARSRRHVERILESLWDGDDTDAVIVLAASLTDPVGVGAAPVLAEALAGFGACVVPVVVEGTDLTARLALHCLSEHAASVIAIDPAFVGLSFGRPDADSPLRSLMVQGHLVAATRTVAENGSLSAGEEVSAEVLRQNGRLGRFWMACARPESSPLSALARSALTSLPARAQDFASAYLVRLSGGPGLRLGDDRRCAGEVQRAARRDVDVLPALVPDDGRRRVEIDIVALGVDLVAQPVVLHRHGGIHVPGR